MTDTITIPLTKGYSTVIDAEDADLVGLRWHASVTLGGQVYARAYIPNKGGRITMHRVILERFMGRALQPGEFADHRDGNTLNCCRGNLRLATRQQNNRNKGLHRNNSSGAIGVSWDKKLNKWHAHITVDYRMNHLGNFSNFDDAVAVRHEAELKYFGEFSPLLSRRDAS